jgi:hypothetical protein
MEGESPVVNRSLGVSPPGGVRSGGQKWVFRKKIAVDLLLTPYRLLTVKLALQARGHPFKSGIAQFALWRYVLW